MPPKQLRPSQNAKSSPPKRKHVQRNESARRRLRVTFDEDDTSSTNDLAHTEDEGPPLQKHQFLQSSNTAEKTSPKAPKRRKRTGNESNSNEGTGHQQKMQSESFIMKLFDRSLDLSMYTQQTPLYPICRAWMENRPRNANLRNYREDTSPLRVKRDDTGVELLDKLKRGWVDIYSMPKAKAVKETKRESAVVEIKEKQKNATPDEEKTLSDPIEVKVEKDNEDDQPKDTNEEPSSCDVVEVKEEKVDEAKETAEQNTTKPWESLIGGDQSHESILVGLKERWAVARKRGQQETHRAYHHRYDTNRKIIEMLYVQTSVLKQSALHQNRHV